MSPVFVIKQMIVLYLTHHRTARADWRGRFSKVVFSILDPSPKSDLVGIFMTAAAEFGAAASS